MSFSRSSSFLTPQKCLTRSCRSAISSPGGSRLSGHQDQDQDLDCGQGQDQKNEHEQEQEQDDEDQDNDQPSCPRVLAGFLGIKMYQDEDYG